MHLNVEEALVGDTRAEIVVYELNVARVGFDADQTFDLVVVKAILSVACVKQLPKVVE